MINLVKLLIIILNHFEWEGIKKLLKNMKFIYFVGEKNHLVLIPDHQKFLRVMLRWGGGSIKGKKGSGKEIYGSG